MATIDPITGLPSSNTQTTYAGDKPVSLGTNTIWIYSGRMIVVEK